MHARRVVVGMGSNLGDRRSWLEQARDMLAKEPGIAIERASDLYETEPVGGPPQGDYANGALLIRSALPAALLLEALLRVEAELGRVRSVPCAPRTVDLDLLWIEGETVRSSTLEVPHPRLAERAFALRPLVDVAPDARDPSGALYASSPLASAPLRALPR